MGEAKPRSVSICLDLERILSCAAPQEMRAELRRVGNDPRIRMEDPDGIRIAFERLQFLEAQEQSAETEDWKRTRAEIEHENSLVNYRLTWLFTLQLLFLAFFAGIFGNLVEGKVTGLARFEAVGLLGLIAILAQIFSIVIYGAINGARIQLDRLNTWWDVERAKRYPHPPLQFWEPSHPFGFLLSDGFIPIWFFYLWALLDGFVLFELASLALEENLYRPAVLGTAAIVYALQAAAAVVVSYKIFANERKSIMAKAVAKARQKDEEPGSSGSKSAG